MTARWKRLAGPVLVIAFAGMAFAAFTVTTNSAQAQTTTSAGVVTATTTLKPGQQLFDEHCASCHGVDAQGTERAPSLWTAGSAGVNFMLSTGRMPLNNAKKQALSHTPYFTPKQIDQITQFVVNEGKSRGKSGPDIPTVQPLCKDQDNAELQHSNGCVTLSQGQQLYTMNCAACHNAQGSGGMLSNGNQVPDVLHATKTQIAEAPRVGPRPMPRFGDRQLSENQLSAIVHYVQFLQHPHDRGGMPIGHFGPLGEGFVGILLGFGSLLLIVRLMGTRG